MLFYQIESPPAGGDGTRTQLPGGVSVQAAAASLLRLERLGLLLHC